MTLAVSSVDFTALALPRQGSCNRASVEGKAAYTLVPSIYAIFKMGCCGESVVSANTPDTQYANRAQPVNNGIISQQPGPHPGAQHHIQPFGEKPPLLIPPGPSPPPPSFQQNNRSINGTPWSHSPSPPPQGPAYSAPLSPNLGGAPLMSPPAAYAPPGPSNSTAFFTPLFHPDPIHAPLRSNSVTPSTSTAVTSARINPAPSDEGKMSISIDFGEYSHCYWRSLVLTGMQELPFLAL